MNRAEVIAAIKTALDADKLAEALVLATRHQDEFPDVSTRALAAIQKATAAAEHAAIEADRYKPRAGAPIKLAPKGVALMEGLFTVEDEQGHLTFKVERQSETAKFAPGELIVSRLTGPSRKTDFKGVAFAKTDGRINVWAKFREDARLASALRVLAQDPTAGAKTFAQVSKCCPKCGDDLTNPRSLAAGIGPKCASDWGWAY